MMRLSNGELADDPLGRFREGWRLTDRRVLTVSLEVPMPDVMVDGCATHAERELEAIATALLPSGGDP
jgi:hypothetical protein